MSVSSFARKLPRVAIVGAGPIGLDMALHARELGLPITIYERGPEAGHNVARWGFVELSSPWRLNVSSVGLETLEREGAKIPDADAYPTGRAFREAYLEPIARSLKDAIRLRTTVLAIGREGLLKGEAIGARERAERPFRILLRDERRGEERYEEAEIVIDASGVYDHPSGLGPGGLPLPRERECERWIDRHLPDLLGVDRDRFAGKRILLVGGGYSAATALDDLAHLAVDAPTTRILWIRRRTDPPRPIPNDPLPARRRLSELACEIASGARRPSSIDTRGDTWVEDLRPAGASVVATLRHDDGSSVEETYDRILALTGYRPDLSIYRELQVHLCYASEGPMKLAALLLGASGGGDCLAAPAAGADSLVTSEPGFFVLGAKSYGRRNDFLLRTGYEQTREIASKLAELARETDDSKDKGA